MGQSLQDTLPPTPRQVAYAQQIANRLHQRIPSESAGDRRVLSEWIGLHQVELDRARPTHGSGATSKQVAFAEKIAQRKRLAVPDECFRDVGLMSRWIDSNR